MVLFDCPSTVVNLETAFETMLIKARQGEAPEALDITP
jgi:hypothetical protein